MLIMQEVEFITMDFFGSNYRHYSLGAQVAPDLRQLYSQAT